MCQASKCQDVAQILLACLFAAPAVGQPVFTENGAANGIEAYTMVTGMGAGIAVADYGGDSALDIYVPTAAGLANQFYVNQGDGQFVESAAGVGLDFTDGDAAALWFDYDGDGDLDLVTLCNAGCDAAAILRLFRQLPDGTLENVTADAGLQELITTHSGMHVGGLSAGDLNQDGYLDLYVTYWEGNAYLLLNDGSGGFVDVAAASGMDEILSRWQPILHDFDGDGWLDIFQAVDFLPNALWINQRDGTFIDAAAAAGVDNAFNDMGVTLGDYDDDGDFDLYITNVFRDEKYNILYRNDTTSGDPLFLDVSYFHGVFNGGWGWGTTFFDSDNSASLDLAATNGAWGSPWIGDASRLWLNDGGAPPVFVSSGVATGFADTEWGSGLIAFDFDRDGDLDVIQSCANGGPLRLLENNPVGSAATNHFLVVRPRMDGPNSHAIGAVIRASIGNQTQSRLITAGTSFLSQEPAEAHFGLGSATVVDTLSIEWPDGSESTMTSVAADQVLTIQHGGFGDLDASGAVDSADVEIFANCYTGVGPGDGTILYGAECQPADMNGDGDADCEDWRILEAAYQEDNGALPFPDQMDLVHAILGLDMSGETTCMADLNADGLNDASDIVVYVERVALP